VYKFEKIEKSAAIIHCYTLNDHWPGNHPCTHIDLAMTCLSWRPGAVTAFLV